MANANKRTTTQQAKQKNNAGEDTRITRAENFCKAFEVEKKVREVIAGIAAKLNRSNLSVEEGKRCAKQLMMAFKNLEKVEKYFDELSDCTDETAKADEKQKS